MGFLTNFIGKNNLGSHDGRPLWKYNLSDDDYQELKKYLSKLTRQSGYFDPRDITLFYAEWWKNEYNGGTPGKDDVYNTLGRCLMSEEEFYRHAQTGAVKLGLKWIQRTNTLKFRTLLLQGGLPITHLLKNQGSYTRFLKKVLELKPTSISEFAYEPEITGILTPSSRNEAIFESCLQIVQAIWSGNDEYLSIFENKKSTTASFKDISDELKKHKNELEKKAKKRSKFKSYWVLHQTQAESSITIEFSFPDSIDDNDLMDLIYKDSKNISESILKSEYRLIINDTLICKFRKTIKGDYKVILMNNHRIVWNGDVSKPETYLLSNDGGKFEFPILLIDYPKISEPTLWTQKSEDEWILQKGKYCSQPEAAILFNNSWTLDVHNPCETVTLYGQPFMLYKFAGEIELINDVSESISFITNRPSFSWYLFENKPEWILKSNIPVVRNWPRIIVTNNENETINDVIFSWRLYGRTVWNRLENSVPQGCIEYKMEALNCEEKDCFYNIGALDLGYLSRSPNEAAIDIRNRGILTFILKDDVSFVISHEQNIIKITLEDIQQSPQSLRARVTQTGQNRDLQLEIVPPFHGVKLFDPLWNILADKSILLFENFSEYRIVSSVNMNSEIKYFLKLSNNTDNSIKIIRELPAGIIPLRTFEELAFQIFQLTDSLDENSSVKLDLIDYVLDDKKTFFIKNHNRTLECNYNNERIEVYIKGQEEDIELFAIPLDCELKNIELLTLQKDLNAYCFPENITSNKFIVFSEFNGNHNSRFLPRIISTDRLKGNFRDIKKHDYVAELNSESAQAEVWGKLKKYYQISITREIPFSSFDIFRAATKTPELVAKLFCFLYIYNEYPNFVDNICKDLENDLGFCFHWVPKYCWSEAITWVADSFENQDVIVNPVVNNIMSFVKGTEPLRWFDKIANYVFNEKSFEIPGFTPNKEIHEIRQKLGGTVVNEMPKTCPDIPKSYSNILPLKEHPLVHILLTGPLAVALSISGKDLSIWNDDENSKTIRRNIKYAQWIVPEWYGKAIVYCIYRLHN